MSKLPLQTADSLSTNSPIGSVADRLLWKFDKPRRRPAGRRSRLALLVALLAVSVGVRLPGLFSRAIWEDESVTLLETGRAHLTHMADRTRSRPSRQKPVRGTVDLDANHRGPGIP